MRPSITSPKISDLRKTSINVNKQTPKPNFQFLRNKKIENNIKKVKIAPNGFVGISTIVAISRKKALRNLHSVCFSCFRNPIDIGKTITRNLGRELVFWRPIAIPLIDKGIFPKISNLILGMKLRTICEAANKQPMRLPMISAFMTFSLFNSLTRNSTRKYRMKTKKERNDELLLMENTTERKTLNITLKIIMESNLLFKIKKEPFFSLINKTIENNSAVIAKGKEIGINIIDKSPDLSAVLFNNVLL